MPDKAKEYFTFQKGETLTSTGLHQTVKVASGSASFGSAEEDQHVFISAHNGTEKEGWVEKSKLSLMPPTDTLPQWGWTERKAVLGVNEQTLIQHIWCTLQGVLQVQPESSIMEFLKQYYQGRTVRVKSMYNMETGVMPMLPYEVKKRGQLLDDLLSCNYEDRCTEWEGLWKDGLPVDSYVKGQSLVHRASGQGDLQCVRMLMDQGADLAQPSSYDASVPVEVATLLGHEKIVRVLTRSGVCIGRSAHIAAAMCHTTLLQFFMDTIGVQVGFMSNGVSLLELAIEGGHHQIARLLVPKLPEFDGTNLPVELLCGATVAQRFQLGANSSVLAFAAKLGRHKIICVLKHMLNNELWNKMLEHRDSSSVKEKQKSAFDVACFHIRPLLYKQYSAVWQVLSSVFAGDVVADILHLQLRSVIAEDVATPRRLVNAQNARGFTALMLAAAKGDLDMSKLLVHRNADLHVTTWGNVTAVLWAQWNEWLAAVASYDGKVAKDILADPEATCTPQQQAAKLLKNPKKKRKQQLTDVSYMLNQRVRNPTDDDKDGLRNLKTQYCQAYREKDKMALRLLGNVSAEAQDWNTLQLLGNNAEASQAFSKTGSMLTPDQLLPPLVHMCIEVDIKKESTCNITNISETDQTFVKNYIISPFLESYKKYMTTFAEYKEEHTTDMQRVIELATGFGNEKTKDTSRNSDALTNRKEPNLEADIKRYSLQATTCQTTMKAKLEEIMAELLPKCDKVTNVTVAVPSSTDVGDVSSVAKFREGFAKDAAARLNIDPTRISIKSTNESDKPGFVAVNFSILPAHDGTPMAASTVTTAYPGQVKGGANIYYMSCDASCSSTSQDPPRARLLDPLAKQVARAREKTLTKYEGDVSRLRDGSRFAVSVSDLPHLTKLAEILQTPSESDPFVWEETRNRFTKATPMGWRDLQIFVRVTLPDEKTHLCEIQLQLEKFYQVRITEHHNYGILRKELPKHFGLTGDDVNGAMRKLADVIEDMNKYRKKFTNKLLQTKSIQRHKQAGCKPECKGDSTVSVWPWESAEDAVTFHMAEHKNEIVTRADLIAQVCGEINNLSFENRQQLSLSETENTASSQNDAFVLTEKPEFDLDEFLYRKFDRLLLRSTGSERFPNLGSLMSNAKLFVQDVVASRKCHLDPKSIFALFVFCLDSNIQRFCVAAMQPSKLRKQGPRHPWYPLIYHTHMALKALPPLRSGCYVFRGVHRHAPDKHGVQTPFEKADVTKMLVDFQTEKEVNWSGFTTCTPSLHVAASWALPDTKASATATLDFHGCGVVFKIRCKQRARDVSDFSLTPWQKEVVFLNDTRFKVVRHVTFQDALADLHLTSNKSKLLDGEPIDTGFVKRKEFTAARLQKDSSLMVIELEEL